MAWTDAFLNAAMLLRRHGARRSAGQRCARQVFAGGYALYCGVAFIATAGLIIAPVGTHILHKFHLDQQH